MIKIKLTTDKAASKAAQRKLRKLASRVDDARPANRRVGIWLLRWVNQNFSTEGGKVGGWKPFKAGGRKGPRGFDTNAKLLQDTGRLRASFDYKANKHSVTIGSELKYSLYHEEGLPLRGLPARRMLPENTDRDVTEGIIKIYDTYINRAIKRQ